MLSYFEFSLFLRRNSLGSPTMKEMKALLLLLVSRAGAFAPLSTGLRPFNSLLATLEKEAPSLVQNKELWSPSQAEDTAMFRFKETVGVKGGYEELWEWSVKNSDEFWTTLLKFLELETEGSLEPVKEGTRMPDVTSFLT